MTTLSPKSVLFYLKVNPEHPYGFERVLMPSYISSAIEWEHELYFLIKWYGREAKDAVSAKETNTKCPEIVIRFYESKK